MGYYRARIQLIAIRDIRSHDSQYSDGIVVYLDASTVL